MITAFNKDNRGYLAMIAFFLLAVAGAAILEINYLFILPFAALLFYKGWQSPAMVFYLLLLSLPFSFEYNFTPSLGTDIPDEALMLMVTFLFIAQWIFQPGIVGKQALKHPLISLLLVHLGWILVASIFSTDFLLSLKYLLAKSWYIGAFVLGPLIVFRDKRTIKNATIILLAAMLIATLIILYRHSLMGFNFATVNEAVAPFFRNHVNYSSMLVCLVPLLIPVYQLSTNKTIRGFVLLIAVIFLAALFFSYARGAWLALATGMLAWFFARKKLLVRVYVIAILFTAAFVFWLQDEDRYLKFAHDYKTTIYHEDFSQHLVATYKLKDVSTAERFYRWIAGVRMIKDDALTGFGPNTFYLNYKPYAMPAFKTWVSDNPEHSTVHNYFLLLLIEQGVPGLVFFLLLFGAILFYAQHLYHRITDTFYKAVALTTGIVASMIAAVNFLSDLIETDKVGSLFFLCLSVLVVTDVRNRVNS